jgi:predicted permease
MERLFDDMRGEGATRSGPGFWARLIWDTVRGAALEWALVVGRRRGLDRRRRSGMLTEWSDARYAIRQLVREPAYAATVVLLMALGIGGNVAVFRVLNGLFVRPLPFERPEQLVDLDETAPQWNLDYVSVAFADFVRWRSDNRTFQSMAAFSTGGLNLSGGGAAERVDYVAATHDLDDVLGIVPQLGRFYDASEDLPNGPRVGLISDRFWRDRYDRSPDVLGRTVMLDGQQVEIVGVLGPEAGFLAEADFWLPLRSDPTDTGSWWLTAIGRMRDGVTVEQAAEDLRSVHRAMIPERSVNEITSPVVALLRDRYVGEYRLAGGFLMAAVAVVLLIACANIAGLVLARSLGRSREVAVRVALGAPRARIIRQLLTESGMLAFIGGTLGAGLGIWGSGRVIGGMGDDLPTWVRFELDAGLVIFMVAATALAALLFGLAPALHASSSAGGLNALARSSAGRGKRRAMDLLVAAEVSLALALLVVGGLTMLDLREVGATEPGFEAGDVITWNLQLPSPEYTSESRANFADEYVRQLIEMPGVMGATIANALPLGGHQGYFFEVIGSARDEEADGNPVVMHRGVTPGYFETLGIELVSGRSFNELDGREDGARVAIVDETFVRTFMEPNANPVGRRIRYPGDDDEDAFTVVGVAADVKQYGLDEDIAPGVYVPLRLLTPSTLQVAVRVVGADRAGVVTAARSLTHRMDPGLALYEIAVLEESVHESIWARRTTTWVIGLFSVIALLLSVAGLYGLISYMVGQRSREIGIRLAVGARAGQVGRQVVGEGLRIVALGTVAGLALAWAGARLASGLLVGVSATNPAVYAAVAILLLLVALAANAVPARRAARTDPATVLRE